MEQEGSAFGDRLNVLIRLLNVERHEPVAVRIERRFLIAYPVEEVIQDGRGTVEVRVAIVLRGILQEIAELGAELAVVEPEGVGADGVELAFEELDVDLFWQVARADAPSIDCKGARHRILHFLYRTGRTLTAGLHSWLKTHTPQAG
jgi:hypothetical protein